MLQTGIPSGMDHRIWVTLVILGFCLSVQGTDGEVDNTKLYVTLYPPENITLSFVSKDLIWIYWYPPQVYFHRTDGVVSTPRTDTQKTATTKAPIVTTAPTQEVKSDNETDSNSTTPHVVVNKPIVVGIPHTPHYLNKTSEPNVVPFFNAALLTYVVCWKNNFTGKTGCNDIPFNVTTHAIHDLDPLTKYRVNVTAVYFFQGLHLLVSDVMTVTTLRDTFTTCECDPHGTMGGGLNCGKHNDTHPPCVCRDGYNGMFCEHCSLGYYRISPISPCYKCPCDTKNVVGTPSCRFDNEYLQCDNCKPGHTGRHCEKCKIGYFQYTYAHSCIPCSCHGNSPFCHQETGECLNCKHNTTGFTCERCKPGYDGDPIRAKTCIHHADLSQASTTNKTLIAGICVAVILVLCAIIGLVVYKRCSKYPNARPFWTVELQDDHEGVSFSSVPEDENYQPKVSSREEDMDFYEKHGGGSGRKGSQKYAQLKEDA